MLLTIHPCETDALLANPGMGWQTFHTFADEDPHLRGLPSSSAYFRFYWREVESAEGEIDFARIDDLLAHARRAGQQLAFRIMCTGSGAPMDVPAYLREQGCPGVDFRFEGHTCWVPDFTAPLFQRAHARLIRELGTRYDGHPDIDLLDIGSVGLWGEWHMGDTQALETGAPVPLPPVEIQQQIIDDWRAAFPRTQKVLLIGSELAMRRATPERMGWRADCLGDMGGFSPYWNHMEHFYLQQLRKSGAWHAWKTGPVAFESCWDMRKWVQEGWDVRMICDYALLRHASYMNNKSAPIPAGSRAEVERFLRRLGYRLVLRRLTHPAAVMPGGTVTLKCAWENIGVAPPYRDYLLALRLTDTTGRATAPRVTVTAESIRGWLPGKHTTDITLSLPKSCRPGRYALAVALVDLRTKQPAVALANEGRDEEGWYPLSMLDVQHDES